MKISVIGAGSFGTSLGILLKNKGYDVIIYARKEAQAAMINATRGNHKYLPGVILPDGLNATSDLREAVSGADLLVMAVPAQSFRSVMEEISTIRNDIKAVNVAKGIEISTLKRMSEVAQEFIPDMSYACLSGPSHAEEVARNLPTAVCVSSKDQALPRGWYSNPHA